MRATDEIYERYSRQVYRYLLSLTQDVALSEELTQETFYQGVKNIHKYDQESCQMGTWLCGIAKNLLLAHQRKEQKGRELQETLMENLAGVSPSAEDDVVLRESKVNILKAMHDFPEVTKEILLLRIFGNLSFREIGDVIGKTENYARVTYFRGIGKLRKEVAKDED